MASESEIIGYADGEPIYAEGPLSYGEDVPKKGFVYFVQASHGGPVKIGYSVDPGGRLRELQSGSPYWLVLRHSIEGDRTRENELHRQFKEHRLGGEWFTPCPELMEIAPKVLLEEGKPVPWQGKVKSTRRRGGLFRIEENEGLERLSETVGQERAYWRDQLSQGRIRSPKGF